MDLSKVETSQIRAAALAWRTHQARIRFPWPFDSLNPNMSLHDNINDLIDEIERLRHVRGKKQA